MAVKLHSIACSFGVRVCAAAVLFLIASHTAPRSKPNASPFSAMHFHFVSYSLLCVVFVVFFFCANLTKNSERAKNESDLYESHF